MKIKNRVGEVLEHYDYALVKVSGNTHTNEVFVEGTTPKELFKYLTIIYGAEGVSKAKGKVRVDEIPN